MRAFVLLSLLLSSFAIPSAHAQTCVPLVVCVEAEGYGSGSCEDGYNVNHVQVATIATGASASTFCWTSGEQHAHGVGASTLSCAVVVCVMAGAAWTDAHFTNWQSCDTFVVLVAGGVLVYEGVGCPVGPPPTIPRVLP